MHRLRGPITIPSIHLLLVGIITLLAASRLVAASGATVATNHSNPAAAPSPCRPFYVIGHEADKLTIVKHYLDMGASGVECNVDSLDGHPDDLRIGHGPWLGSGPVDATSVPLKDFLIGLHQMARQYTNFCIVYFDCKHPIATPELGRQLLDSIRTYFTCPSNDPVPVNIMLSVGKLEDQPMFAEIATNLGPRESIMVDGDSRPRTVTGFFASSHAPNYCFSDGTVPFNTFLSHFEVYASVKRACMLRRNGVPISFIGTWTVNNPPMMRKFIKLGVDGIVADDKFRWYNFSWVNMGNGLRSLKQIVDRDGAKYGIRQATRADDPFPGGEPVSFLQIATAQTNNTPASLSGGKGLAPSHAHILNRAN